MLAQKYPLNRGSTVFVFMTILKGPVHYDSLYAICSRQLMKKGPQACIYH